MTKLQFQNIITGQAARAWQEKNNSTRKLRLWSRDYDRASQGDVARRPAWHCGPCQWWVLLASWPISPSWSKMGLAGLPASLSRTAIVLKFCIYVPGWPFTMKGEWQWRRIAECTRYMHLSLSFLFSFFPASEQPLPIGHSLTFPNFKETVYIWTCSCVACK